MAECRWARTLVASAHPGPASPVLPVPIPVAHRVGAIALRVTLGVAVLAAAACASPAATRAADLVLAGRCFAEGQPVTLAGTAFTPNAPVIISGDVRGTTQADALGAFTTEIMAPRVKGLGPERVTVVTTDAWNTANRSTLHFFVVHEAFGSNRPVAGTPAQWTTWRFAGFVPGRPIYGHFVLNGRSHGDHRFGMARGPCGTLTVRAPRIPGVRRLRPGLWTLKLDQRKRYRASVPGSAVRFRILRRPGV
jgi:hypothetical protein